MQTDAQREQIIAATDSIINHLTDAYDAFILDPAPTCLRNEDFQNINTTKLRIFFRSQVMRTVRIFFCHIFMNLRIAGLEHHQY